MTQPTDPSTPDPNQPQQPARPEQPPQPAPPPKKKKRRRWLKITLGMVLVLILLVVFLPQIASMGFVRSIVVGKVNDNLNGKVAIADWSLGWTGGVDVNGTQAIPQMLGRGFSGDDCEDAKLMTSFGTKHARSLKALRVTRLDAMD